jgi:hypothetical protein
MNPCRMHMLRTELTETRCDCGRRSTPAKPSQARARGIDLARRPRSGFAGSTQAGPALVINALCSIDVRQIEPYIGDIAASLRSAPAGASHTLGWPTPEIDTTVCCRGR